MARSKVFRECGATNNALAYKICDKSSRKQTNADRIEGRKPINSPVREKALLVMDMPESCCKCRMAHLADRDKVMCSIDRMATRNYADAVKDRPDWCPLVTMPEKRPFTGEDAVVSPRLSGRVQQALKEAFAMGWNACIDAIGGKDSDGE